MLAVGHGDGAVTHPYEKWRPYLHRQKIVAVTFEDGSAIETNEAEIRGYLKCLDDRKAEITLSGLGRIIAPDVAAHYGRLIKQARRMQASVDAHVRASKPRKASTKKLSPAKVLAFMEAWQQKYPKKRGKWKAAALEFKVSEKKLRDLLNAAERAATPE